MDNTVDKIALGDLWQHKHTPARMAIVLEYTEKEVLIASTYQGRMNEAPYSVSHKHLRVFYFKAA